MCDHVGWVAKEGYSSRTCDHCVKESAIVSSRRVRSFHSNDAKEEEGAIISSRRTREWMAALVVENASRGTLDIVSLALDIKGQGSSCGDVQGFLLLFSFVIRRLYYVDTDRSLSWATWVTFTILLLRVSWLGGELWTIVHSLLIRVRRFSICCDSGNEWSRRIEVCSPLRKLRRVTSISKDEVFARAISDFRLVCLVGCSSAWSSTPFCVVKQVYQAGFVFI